MLQQKYPLIVKSRWTLSIAVFDWLQKKLALNDERKNYGSVTQSDIAV